MYMPIIYHQTDMLEWLLLSPSFEMLFPRVGPDTLFIQTPFFPAQHLAIIPHAPLKAILHIPPRKCPIPRHCPRHLLMKKSLVNGLPFIFYPGRIWIQRLLCNW